MYKSFKQRDRDGAERVGVRRSKLKTDMDYHTWSKADFTRHRNILDKTDRSWAFVKEL